MNDDTRNKESWKDIATFSTDWEAHIAQGVLDEHDIPSVLNNEAFASVYPIGFNTIGGITLLVPANKAEEALELIKNCDKGEE